MPERFGLEYVNHEGGASRPVMIHRAVLGSLERFMGIFIEHYGGAFPLWLAPMQISLIPIAQTHETYATDVAKKLKDEGFRVEVKPQSETLGARIRRAQTEKIPYMLVVGDKEAQAGKVAVRSRKLGDQGAIELSQFIHKIKVENDN